MPKRSRIARGIIERLEHIRIQIIPRDAESGYIRGDLGPKQLDVLEAVLPDLRAHWGDVLHALTNRDENEAAAAAIRIITTDEENPAALLGRRGGLKGGPARAAKLSKKQLSESARKAARARWGKK